MRLFLVLTALSLIPQPWRTQTVDPTDGRTPEEEWQLSRVALSFVWAGFVAGRGRLDNPKIR